MTTPISTVITVSPLTRIRELQEDDLLCGK
jgi:hypothetical protein